MALPIAASDFLLQHWTAVERGNLRGPASRTLDVYPMRRHATLSTPVPSVNERAQMP
jgi:hypothetical protein